jgi:MFS transporter, FSR family, fosmidomycin resistance protein
MLTCATDTGNVPNGTPARPPPVLTARWRPGGPRGSARPGDNGRSMATTVDREHDAPAAPHFDTPTILSVAGAHLVHDTYPAFVGVLLPLLIPKLGLSLAVAGLLAATFRVATGIQPILGIVADRADTRYWIILAPAATAIAIGLLGLAPTPWVVALLLMLAGFSSAVFHPAAAALVTRSAGTQWGRGTSIFMTGGESGRAIGPVVIAAVLTVVGLGWSWIAIVPGVLASGVLYLRLAHRAEVHLRQPAGSIRAALRSARRGFLLLAGASAMMSMAGVGLLVFIPTYLTGAGAGIVLAGIAVTAFEIGGATGAFLGGTLSDRIGRRTMLAIASGVGAPLLILALAMPVGPLMLVVLALAGVVVLSAGPVQLVLMQELLPDNRGAAVGLSIFVITMTSALGTLAVGAIGEAIGLQAALLLAASASLLALPFIALLPETRHVSGAAA